MAFDVVLSRQATKQFDALSAEARKRVARQIDRLSETAQLPGAQKLAGGHDLWRLRAGPYRIVYAEPDADAVIHVLKIGHRRDVYRGL